MIRIPGLIDPHVHLRDPGQTDKEDFFTGTSAAVAGGFTAVLDMPNNKVPITSLELLEQKIQIAKEKIVCNIGFHFGSTGDNLDEFEKVSGKVFGLKLYLNETTGNFKIESNALKQIFQTWDNAHASSLHSDRVHHEKPILVHAEDEKIEEVINLVRELRTRVHFCHISTQIDLEQVIEAKNAGLPITCGVTPHHLFLSEENESELGPFGLMKPPLRPSSDVQFLWKNLSAIDCIESDHAPHTKEEKEGSKPPFGVPGLETTLPLLLSAMNHKLLTLDDIVRLCHTGPSRIFGIVQSPETFVELDPNSEFIIHNSELKTKCGWSPFDGWKGKGKVVHTVINGRTVFENGKILASPGSGSVI